MLTDLAKGVVKLSLLFLLSLLLWWGQGCICHISNGGVSGQRRLSYWAKSKLLYLHKTW